MSDHHLGWFFIVVRIVGPVGVFREGIKVDGMADANVCGLRAYDVNILRRCWFAAKFDPQFSRCDARVSTLDTENEVIARGQRDKLWCNKGRSYVVSAAE